jgi:2-hydroxy-3-oxopropionate reductase
MKIGFIGLGIMGKPMALHLKAAGHEVVVPERASLDAESRGAFTVVANATAVAQAAEVIILMVPDTPDVEAVLFGQGGVAAGLSAGKLVIDMSSISPTATKTFAGTPRSPAARSAPSRPA